MVTMDRGKLLSTTPKMGTFELFASLIVDGQVSSDQASKLGAGTRRTMLRSARGVAEWTTTCRWCLVVLSQYIAHILDSNLPYSLSGASVDLSVSLVPKCLQGISF